jgi:hypothetical protein
MQLSVALSEDGLIASLDSTGGFTSASSVLLRKMSSCFVVNDLEDDEVVKELAGRAVKWRCHCFLFHLTRDSRRGRAVLTVS